MSLRVSPTVAHRRPPSPTASHLLSPSLIPGNVLKDFDLERKAKSDFKRLRLTPPRDGAPDYSSRLHTQHSAATDGEAIPMADLNEEPRQEDESGGNPYFW